VASAEAPATLADFVKLKLETRHTAAIKFLKDETRAVAGVGIVAIAARDPTGGALPQFGGDGSVDDMKRVQTFLSIAETGVWGDGIGQ
jgi:hypothetical protein